MIYGILNRGLLTPLIGHPFAPAPGPATLLRTTELLLPHTTYRPPSNPHEIGGGCRHLLHTAAQISDPFEQSLFTLVRLLYLQPFATLNASMACLAANLPLLRVGLPLLTLARIPGRELHAALLALWELNHPALLSATASFNRTPRDDSPGVAASGPCTP